MTRRPAAHPAAERITHIQQMLSALVASYLPSCEKDQVPEWWTVGGYHSILADAVARIAKHERRATRIYGERAVSFNEAVRLAEERAGEERTA